MADALALEADEDALALEADEGRDEQRYASGSCK